MAVVIITIRDTDNGVEVKRSNVADVGESGTPAEILGAAMFDNVAAYLQRHAGRVEHQSDPVVVH